jgi:hypothetical protein
MIVCTIGQRADAADSALAHVGKSFLFDYGDFVVRVRYLSGTRLEWERVKGPQVGLKGEEEYGHSVVRDDVVFIWWQEKDLGIVTQVVDFGKGSVHTTWTSPREKTDGLSGEDNATSIASGPT